MHANLSTHCIKLQSVRGGPAKPITVRKGVSLGREAVQLLVGEADVGNSV